MNNRSSTSDAILACTRKLIVSGGYNGFSYADIAEVVGIRKPSIHHHFPTKVDLVTALLADYRQEAEAGFENLASAIADPLGQLRAYIQYWSSCITDASAPFCVCAMLASELPALPGEVALAVRAHFRFLSSWVTSVLERGVQQGTISLQYPARVEAEAFMATVHGAMLSARAYGEADVFAAIMQPLLERMAVKR